MRQTGASPTDCAARASRPAADGVGRFRRPKAAAAAKAAQAAARLRAARRFWCIALATRRRPAALQPRCEGAHEGNARRGVLRIRQASEQQMHVVGAWSEHAGERGDLEADSVQVRRGGRMVGPRARGGRSAQSVHIAKRVEQKAYAEEWRTVSLAQRSRRGRHGRQRCCE